MCNYARLMAGQMNAFVWLLFQSRPHRAAPRPRPPVKGGTPSVIYEFLGMSIFIARVTACLIFRCGALGQCRHPRCVVSQVRRSPVRMRFGHSPHTNPQNPWRLLLRSPEHANALNCRPSVSPDSGSLTTKQWLAAPLQTSQESQKLPSEDNKC